MTARRYRSFLRRDGKERLHHSSTNEMNETSYSFLLTQTIIEQSSASNKVLYCSCKEAMTDPLLPVSSSPSPSRETILPELSRSYKWRHFSAFVNDHDTSATTAATSTSSTSSTTQSRKRKFNNNNNVPSSSALCFEVRRCVEKGGVGMFATQDIQSGTLIIPHEDPIVCCVGETASGQFFCTTCRTPIGSLRDHLGAPSDLTLPYLQAQSNGLEFIDDPAQIVRCEACQTTVWCSKQCQERQSLQHSFTCLGGDKLTTTTTTRQQTLLDFYSSLQRHDDDDDASPLMFRLAVDVITLALSKVRMPEQHNIERPPEKLEEAHLYWWRDYGSHPHWWKSGLAMQDANVSSRRKDQSQRFGSVLQSVLLEAIEIMNKTCISGNGSDSEKQLLVAWTKRLCSLDPVGEILGMLACNVMEFEYPSPVQQYMDFLLQDEDGMEEEPEAHESDPSEVNDDDQLHEAGNCRNKNTENSCSTESSDQGKALAWLAKNVTMNEGEENREEQDAETETDVIVERRNPPVIASPVVGSGLYPLLTLANHDCNPNASIDFLQESNRGSMVAMRNIAAGEEITITYVPNGGLTASPDSEESSNRFRHFEPTRTWKWLHQFDDDAPMEAEDDEEKVEHPANNSDGSVGEENHNDQACSASDFDDTASANSGSLSEKGELEGANCKERREALLEYNFECQCQRCVKEMGNSDETNQHDERDLDRGECGQKSDDEEGPRKDTVRLPSSKAEGSSNKKRKGNSKDSGEDSGERMVDLAAGDDKEPNKRVVVLSSLHVGEAPTANRKLVLKAVSQNGMALAYASAEFRNDREIVLRAINQNGWAIQFAHEKFRNDREIVLCAVSRQGLALKFASEELRNDHEVVLEAAKKDKGYRYVGQKLWQDRNFVLRAVSLNGFAFQRASQQLRNDREVALRAVTEKGSALMYASEGVKRDREVVLQAVSNEGSALGYAAIELRSDREIVSRAVSKRGWALRYAAQDLREDRELVLQAVSQSGFALEFASHNFQNDPTVVGVAIRTMDKMIQAPNPITNYMSSVHSLKRSTSRQLKECVRSAFIKLQEYDPHVIFSDESSVSQFVEKLRQTTWQKIVCIHQATGAEFATRTILEYADCADDFQFGKALQYIAPVMGACADSDIDWSDICDEDIIENFSGTGSTDSSRSDA